MKQEEQQNQILENLIMEYIKFKAKFQSEEQINKSVKRILELKKKYNMME